eukprot:552614-Prorocentrum_minimum.AAC.3
MASTWEYTAAGAPPIGQYMGRRGVASHGQAAGDPPIGQYMGIFRQVLLLLANTWVGGGLPRTVKLPVISAQCDTSSTSVSKLPMHTAVDDALSPASLSNASRNDAHKPHRATASSAPYYAYYQHRRAVVTSSDYSARHYYCGALVVK